MNPYIAEVLAEARLHLGADSRGERLAGGVYGLLDNACCYLFETQLRLWSGSQRAGLCESRDRVVAKRTLQAIGRTPRGRRCRAPAAGGRARLHGVHQA